MEQFLGKGCGSIEVVFNSERKDVEADDAGAGGGGSASSGYSPVMLEGAKKSSSSSSGAVKAQRSFADEVLTKKIEELEKELKDQKEQVLELREAQMDNNRRRAGS